MASKKKAKEAMTIMAGETHTDRMLSKKDGIFELRFGFFYRHGGTSEKKAAKVTRVIHGIEVVEHFENWQAWPKDSYWVVRIIVVDANVLIAQAQALCEKYGCDWAELVTENKTQWKNNHPKTR